MASANVKARCITCGKENASCKCGGCSQDFCYKHLGDHRQELSKQLDEVEVMRDLFWQTLHEQQSEPQKHSLIEQIDQWEQDSIEKIHQTAEEARQLVHQHIVGHIDDIQSKLKELTNQLRQSRADENFFESDLHQWNRKLTELTEQLAKPSNIRVHQNQTPLVTKISVNASFNQVPLHSINIEAIARWIQNGITVAGGKRCGTGLDQLRDAYGIFVDDDQTVYVADTESHRIVEWRNGATKGEVVAGGKGKGSRNDQLSSPKNVIVDKKNDCLIICDSGNRRVVRWPRQIGLSGEIVISDIGCYSLAMDHEGYLYVSDIHKHEVKRWRIGDTTSRVVAGGNDQGDRLDQLSSSSYIFVDRDRSVYVSDPGNHRVMKWVEGTNEGIIVAGGHGAGNSLAQLNCPRGIVVDDSGTVYVADDNNNRVIRWPERSKQGSVVVGGNGKGNNANQISGPTGLSLDSHGNLYVVDFGNDRVQKFHTDSSSSS